MLRRHFFLAGAIVVLILMLVAGAYKLTVGKKQGPGGPPGAVMAQGGGGGRPGGGGGGRGGMGGPADVAVVVVQSRLFTDVIDVIGVAKGRQSVILTAAATQLVERVRFSPGQSVGRGAVLVELKATEQDAGLAQAQASLIQAQRAYDRYRTLGQQGFASKAMIDQYEANYLSAKANVVAAQARQGDRLIRAPFAGVVGLSDITQGSLINPGSAIVTLDDTSAIRVDFQVPDRYIASVRQGQAVTAKVDAYPGEVIQGRIALLDTRIDEKTRALTARAEFPNPDRRLKPGMMMRVAVAQGSRQGLSAPESAVSVQGDNAFVYVLTKQGDKTVAEQRPVVTGVRQDGFVELKDGVAAGDRIVGDGLNKIQPNQAVKPVGSGQPQGTGGAARRPAA
ncbi:efflux RND transporter periplasmic adaptor subunit [Phenylobacterium sp.]|uniref:efflux RND transporter periplasmic adaptor subunit n=1 Tax=Phenylobacterium sp. TaxID=1871053 RepID=UPI00271D6D18|nr:efflux RND transporter periplasmic adaptor subunit [Phenylobacterium sp.]MDO8802455.1 efflux RND transporter periplasmic adaptor subunit [Phenylobacterium sp.]